MSELPVLLFPIVARIRRIQKTATVYDHVRREPVNTVTRTPEYEIPCQCLWADPNQVQANLPMPEATGVNEQQLGYIVLRVVDIEALPVTIDRGDEITKLADRVVSLFVQRVTFHDHRNGRFQLLRAYFADRRAEGANG